MARITPGLPHSVVRTSDDLYIRDGELVRGWDLTIPPETFEQFRQGYRCIKCYCAQDEPFPEVCKEVWPGGGCGFRMRDEQMKFLEQQFKGEHSLWPTHAA